MEAALLDLEQVNDLVWFERFLERSIVERRAILAGLAAERWVQKRAFAAKRLEAWGWARCCHQSVLEVLGYARNRAAMHKIAMRYSRADFTEGVDIEQIFEDFRMDWKLSGCRPANHPKLRLQQYASICGANPDWPEQLSRVLSGAVMTDESDVAPFRKATGAKDFEARISQEIFQGVIGSKRLGSLLCDAVFPLADCALPLNWEGYWQHWYPGDYPGAFSRFYRQAGLTEVKSPPISNGTMQGILALFMNKGEGL
jgi:hypothetical protein